MEAKKSVMMTLTIVLLLIGILATGKYLFMSGDEKSGAASDIGRYQVNCTQDFSSKVPVTCVEIDTTTGEVVNIFKPRGSFACTQFATKNTKACNATLVDKNRQVPEAASIDKKVNKGAGAKTPGAEKKNPARKNAANKNRPEKTPAGNVVPDE